MLGHAYIVNGLYASCFVQMLSAIGNVASTERHPFDVLAIVSTRLPVALSCLLLKIGAAAALASQAGGEIKARFSATLLPIDGRCRRLIRECRKCVFAQSVAASLGTGRGQ